MRPIECILVCLLAAGAVWRLVAGPQARAIFYFFLGLSITLLLLHLLLEGAHWQMAPAYLATIVFCGLVVFRNHRGPLQSAGAWVVIFLVVLASCFSVVLPMFKLPKPTGSYAIGTRIIFMVDPSRQEETIENVERHRELMVQIWYPAEPSRKPLAPYRRLQETTHLSSYQSVLWTHARLEAPIARQGDPFPVLLFNPAWTGRRTQNTFLAEDLASHGYVVAGIDHTYNSGAVAFPDGRVVKSMPDPGMDFSIGPLERVEAAAEKELTRQTDDDLFVLDQLQSMNGDARSPFYGRVDANTAGAFGHSFGGAVAAQACYLDPRIRAALDLDGSLFGEVQREGLHKPFMFISEDATQPTRKEQVRMNMESSIDAALDENDAAMVRKSGGFRIFLQGSTHASFTDRALFSPFKKFSGAGEIPPRRQVLIIRSLALAFFDQALKEKPSSMLVSRQSPFAEAAFDTAISESQ
jgi:dienelactone hydrolase